MGYLVLATEEEAKEEAAVLKGIGPAARRILAEVVQTQGIERTSISPTVLALNNAGYVQVNDLSPGFNGPYAISPTFLGEDVMLYIDEGWVGQFIHNSKRIRRAPKALHIAEKE